LIVSNPSVVNLRPVKCSSTEHKPFEGKRNIETVFGKAIEAFVFGKDVSKAKVKTNMQNVHYLFKIS